MKMVDKRETKLSMEKTRRRWRHEIFQALEKAQVYIKVSIFQNKYQKKNYKPDTGYLVFLKM